jgi:hypothetical protein
MAKPIYQIVHYRRFQRNTPSATDPTFEQMCRGALGAKDTAALPLWERAQDRVFTYPAPEDRQILLNRVADLQSAVFGEMCLVQAKDLQALIEMKAQKAQLSSLTTAEIYALSERSAPNGSQFLRGAALLAGYRRSPVLREAELDHLHQHAGLLQLAAEGWHLWPAQRNGGQLSGRVRPLCRQG